MALPTPQQPGETYTGGSGSWFDQQQPPPAAPTGDPYQPRGVGDVLAMEEAARRAGYVPPPLGFAQQLSPEQRAARARDLDAAARRGGWTPPGGGAPTTGQPGASNLPGGDQRAAVEAFIANWQRTHDPHEGIAGLTQALAQQFPGTVTPYLYGTTPSNNEINLGGEKYKVLGGEGGAAAYWYVPGTDDSGGGGDGGGFGRLGGGTGSLAGIAAEALTTSPGYQFRLGEGMKALERSAASKGTLLTGGTLKGLNRYAQDYASGEYGQNYARLFGEQGARYNQLYGLSQLGLSAAGQQAGLNTSYANQAGNLATNQANTGSDLALQNANAGAGGTVGKANATNSAIQAAVNSGNTALVLWLMNQQKNASVPGA